MNSLKTAFTSILIIGLLVGSFYLGYRVYPSYKNPIAQVVEIDTIFLQDTTKYTIPDKTPEYIIIRDSVKYRDQAWMDSVIKANRVDTAAILEDYYGLHYYSRTWEDSLLKVSVDDAIAENRPIHNSFKYQILRPQSIIQNNVIEYSYSKYIYAGLNLPVSSPKYISLDIIAAFPRGYFGTGYSPGLNTLSIKGGIKIIDF